MHGNRYFRFAALGLLLALGACATSRAPLRLFQHNTGDIVNLRVGETMEVVLEGDPTIDVRQQRIPDDPDLLERVGGTEFFADMTTPDARERLLVRFRAVAEGKTRLKLIYKYRYASNTAPDADFEVWVVVKP